MPRQDWSNHEIRTHTESALEPLKHSAPSQEFALSEAEDVAEVLFHCVRRCSFINNCIQTRDFTPRDPEASHEHKFYAPGIGNVLNVKDTGERVELVSFTME